MLPCRPEEIIARVRAVLPRDLAAIRDFDAVAEEAMPFFVALLAAEREAAGWVVCGGVRQRDEFAGELSQWMPSARALPAPVLPGADARALPDPEVAAEQLAILSELTDAGFRGPVVIAAEQLAGEVPAPRALRAGIHAVKVGERGSPVEWAGRLEAAGYERATQAVVRGQFAVRGGIVDVFSFHASHPVRMEFDEEAVASIRAYEPDSQLSTGDLERCDISLSADPSERVPLAALVAGSWAADLGGGSRLADAQVLRAGAEGLPGLFPLPFGELAAGDLVLDSARADVFFRQLESWRDSGWLVVLAAGSEGERSRFAEFASERRRDSDWMAFLPLALSHGFACPSAKLAVLADAALFGRAAALRAGRAAARASRAAASRAATDFSDFAPGDAVVHLEHGIGLFEGVSPSPDDSGEDVLVLRYAGDARLFVPIGQAWQVSRYAGLGRARPPLAQLGSDSWRKTTEKATRSVFDYAARLLRLSAERQALQGHAFAPDSHWQSEFEDAFPHRLTPDQTRATAEVKRDMESSRPTDRLICGDVGFGKTEVAIRAAFKAVMGGKQVAFLAPTTVLARQHFHTLRERLSDYPVTVELLSRYRTSAEQRKVIERLASGGVDIVVGTHRLVSPDVVFRDLGLVVVDEEQRFGVRQKDVLKERFRQVDVLTLSATPIPRTLYMALSGARDLSLIETPPPNRQAVETIVAAYDERIWRDAIRRELARGGQVYFLHNRVRTIERVAARIRELCPGARVVVGHGQMSDANLEPVMAAFVAGDADVLVSTTIIESGLDIPNANTIIIDRADLFGLADLYQLRGRVGRSAAKAYAYLLLPREVMGAARKRVSAIKQYSELGSGFRIAMRDLELRGAGNLLGTAQSGHIVAVGFDLYCKLLKRAVESLSGGARFARRECAVRLDFVGTTELPGPGLASACIPAGYVPDTRTRIACYRALAEAGSVAELDALRKAWRDRFGPLPPSVANALLLARVRLLGPAKGLVSVEVKHDKLMLTRRDGSFLQPGGRFPRLTEPDPNSRLREVFAFVERLPDP